MILLIRKRTLTHLGICACCLLGCLSLLQFRTALFRVIPTFSAGKETPAIVVIDPGHGGEDGGAVSVDGRVSESQLNLEIALRVNDLLRFTGQPTVMTRAEDVSIHTEGETIRARKASDIRNRVALVNKTDPAVLLSVHQNSLPSSPVTHGAQAFWNKQNRAEAMAQTIQDTLNNVINLTNPKNPRQIPDSIYLMKHAAAPAVLIECGFLSNREEAERLQDPSYQTKLATAITTGYLRCLSGEDVP